MASQVSAAFKMLFRSPSERHFSANDRHRSARRRYSRTFTATGVIEAPIFWPHDTTHERRFDFEELGRSLFTVEMLITRRQRHTKPIAGSVSLRPASVVASVPRP